MANFHKYIEFRILETKTCMGCNREENQNGITKTDTVETRYNAVLGVHRSDPRYIRVDGYNAVYVPPPAHEWPVSAVDRLIL